jgi:shikimate kinase
VLISLIGLPGVGKSTIGRRLAQRLELDFVDCDAAIEARLNLSIRAFFEMEGEARFREIESAQLVELMDRDDTVLATGGGVVLSETNRELLRRRTRCIYLHAAPDALFHRLKRDTRRPLLQGPDPAARLSKLFDERDPLYRQTAALEVAVGRRPLDAVLDAIVAGIADPRGARGNDKAASLG